MSSNAGEGAGPGAVEIADLFRSGDAVAGPRGLRVRSPRTGRVLLFLAMTDLDGTVNDEHVVERLRTSTLGPAREAFRRLTECGWSVGVCTARSTGEALQYRELLGIDGPVISENGAVIRLPDGHERVSGRRDDLASAVARIEAVLGRRIPGSLDPAALESIWEDEQAGRLPVELGHADRQSLGRAVDRHASCFLVGLSAEEKRVARRIAADLGMDAFGHLLHLIPRGVDKGSGLTRLLDWVAEEEGPGVDVVPMVFGNGENDLPLFAEAIRRGGAAVLVGDGRSPGGFHFDTARHPVPSGTLCMAGLPHGRGIGAGLKLLEERFVLRHGIRFPWSRTG